MARPPVVEDAILDKYEDVLRLDKPGWEYDGAANYEFGGLDAFSVLEAGIRSLGADKVQVLDVGCGGGGFLKQLHKRFPDLGGFVGLTGDTYGSMAATTGRDATYPWINFDASYFDAFPDPHKDKYKNLFHNVLGDATIDHGGTETARHRFVYGVPVEQLGFFVDPERFFHGERFDFIFVSWTFVHMVDPIGMLSTLYNLLKPGSGVLLGNTFVPLFAKDNSLVPLLEWMWVLRSKNLQICLEEESVFMVHNGTPDSTMSNLQYGSIVDKVWRTILQQQQRLTLSYDVVPGAYLCAARSQMHEGISVANVIGERFPDLCSDGHFCISKWNGNVPLAVQQLSKDRFKEVSGSPASDKSWEPMIGSRCWVISEGGESTYEKRSFLNMQDIVEVIAEAGKSRLNVLDLSEGGGNLSVVEIEAVVGGGMKSNVSSFAANLDLLSNPPPAWLEGKDFNTFDVIVCWNPSVFTNQICDPLGVLCRLYNNFLAPGGTLLIGGLSANIVAEAGVSDDPLWLFAWGEYLREYGCRLSFRLDSESSAGWWLQRKPPFQLDHISSDAVDPEVLVWPNVAIGPLLAYHGVGTKVMYSVAKRHSTCSYDYDLLKMSDAFMDSLYEKSEGKLSADKKLVSSLLLPSTKSRSCGKVEKKLDLSDIASWDGSVETVGGAEAHSEGRSAASADVARAETPIVAAKEKPKPKPKAEHRSSSRASSRRRSSGSPTSNRSRRESPDVGAAVEPRSGPPTAKDLWCQVKEAEGLNYPKAALAIRKLEYAYYPSGEAWKKWLKMSFSSAADWNRYIRSSIFEL